MATNFPVTPDDGTTLPNPTASSYTNSPDHAGLHTNANDSIKAIEAKIGTGVSTPITSGYIFTSSGGGASGWSPAPAAGVWGLITGTLSNQTDLSTALGTKVQVANDLGGTITAPTVVATHLTAPLPITQGGSGSITATGSGQTVLATSPVITTGTVLADPTINLGIASKQYVDNLGTGSLVLNETPVGLINGSNTAYTTASVYATGSLRVYLNGQRLTFGVGNDYVEAGQGFTMQYAPATSDVLLVDYNVTNAKFIQGSNSIIVQETPTGIVNGTNTIFITLQAKYVANTIELFINGLQQTKTTDYTETSPASGTITFTVPPLSGDVLKVSYQFSTGASGNADTVDGFHASATPTASTLLPLNSNSKYPASALDLTNYSGTIAQISALSSTVQASTTTVTVINAGIYLLIVNGEFNGNNSGGDKGLVVSFTNSVAAISNYFTTIAGMYFVQVPINRIITIPANTVVSFYATDSGTSGFAFLGSRSAYSIMRVG